MDAQEIEKRYRKIIRSHPRSGAKWQRTKEIECKPSSGEASPYWNHVHDNHKKHSQWRDADGNSFDESDTANGDGRAFNQKGDIQSLMREVERQEETTVRVRKLLALSKQLLTEQQYNVFIMLAVKEPHLTEREAAKVLSITPGRVHQLWAKAQKKLQEAYDKRTA